MKNYFALPLIALVSGCGGGDSGSGSTQPTTIPGGPVTPPPTPTPTYSYQSAFDFTKLNRFFSPYAETLYSRIGNGVPTPSTAILNENLRIAFVDVFANPLQVSLTVDRDNFVFQGNSDDYKSADGISLFQSFRQFSLYRYRNDTQKIQKPEYVAFTQETYSNTVNQTTYNRTRLFIFGSETNPEDLFKSESRLKIYYSCATNSSIFPEDGNTRSSGSFLAFSTIEYDVSTHKIAGTFNLNQSSYETGKTPLQTQVTVSGTANLPNNTISGDVSSADNVYKGKVFGRFFGPNGVDIGLLYTLSLSGTESTAGTIICSSSTPR